jgi:catechol 2,3-dioxygenase-like lactoylglutathione lyase family enzyme
MNDQRGSAPGLAVKITPSHLILNVADTDATIRFYGGLFGAEATDDMEIASPALDAMFGRAGVRIRSTFIDVGGYRLHTIETLDRTRGSAGGHGGAAAFTGISGLSFSVDDLEAFHAAAKAAGFEPTDIYNVDLDTPEHSASMFFVEDPDGVRCELVAFPQV